MAAKKAKQAPKPQKQDTAAAFPPLTSKPTRPALKAPPKGARPADSGEPGGGQGRVDITGIMPADIRIDPDLTEGHPGYEESGDSEIIPNERFSKRRGATKKE